MGRVRGKNCWKYYERLKNNARKLSNFELIPDLDRENYENHLSKNNIHFHSSFTQRFEIVIPEVSQ